MFISERKEGKGKNHTGVLCHPKIKRSHICDLAPENTEMNPN